MVPGRVGCAATAVTRPAYTCVLLTTIGLGPIETQRSDGSVSDGRGPGGTKRRAFIARSSASAAGRAPFGYPRWTANHWSPLSGPSGTSSATGRARNESVTTARDNAPATTRGITRTPVISGRWLGHSSGRSHQYFGFGYGYVGRNEVRRAHVLQGAPTGI